MKKLFLIFLFLLFVSSLLNAQEQKDSIAKKECRWSIGAYVAPNYTYYKGKSLLLYPTNERGASSYDLGISLNFRLNKHFKILTGGTYNHLRYKSDFNSPLFPNTNTQYRNFLFVATPLQIQYCHKVDNYLLFINCGGELNFLIQKIDGLNNANKLIIPFIITGFGIEKNIYKDLFFLIGFNYQYALVPIYYSYWDGFNLHYSASQNLYSFSLRIGINYNFKNL